MQTYSKSQLASLYMPHVSSSSARRTMRRWIDSMPEFKAALQAAGYRDKSILLTPAQVALHYQYLGTP